MVVIVALVNPDSYSCGIKVTNNGGLGNRFFGGKIPHLNAMEEGLKSRFKELKK